MGAPGFQLTHYLPKWISYPLVLVVLTAVCGAAVFWLAKFVSDGSDAFNATDAVIRFVAVLVTGWLLVAAVMVRIRESRPPR